MKVKNCRFSLLKRSMARIMSSSVLLFFFLPCPSLSISFSENYVVLGMVIAEYHYGAVNPHGELIEELQLILIKLGFIEIDKYCRVILTEGFALFVNQHFGEDEYAILNLGIEVVPDIAHRDFVLDVLKGK